MLRGTDPTECRNTAIATAKPTVKPRKKQPMQNSHCLREDLPQQLLSNGTLLITAMSGSGLTAIELRNPLMPNIAEFLKTCQAPARWLSCTGPFADRY